MRTLRLLRNVSVLFILAMAVLAFRSGAETLRAQNTGYNCISDSNTNGYNCTFDSNRMCSSSKCKAGDTCNNMICPKSCGYKKGSSCYIDANGHCREGGCGKNAFGCLNSGCIYVVVPSREVRFNRAECILPVRNLGKNGRSGVEKIRS